ncbi:MAG TPA: potassium/proton antiporter [Methanoregula sp.]|nr:potassium/proton antiporter [Methanoregula sp.]
MIALEYVLIAAAALVIISILANKVSGRLGVPALLIFIIVGMLAGSEGPGGIYFDDPQIAQTIGIIALSYILFSGGIDTRWSQVKPVLLPGICLSTVGVVLTAIVISLSAVVFLGFSPLEGFLLGAIISSTDAAAVFSVLRSSRASLKGHLRPLLEFESGSNDPMAVFLTIGAITLLTNPGQSILTLIPLFVQQMAIGGLFGYGFGRITVWLLNNLKLEYNGLYPVLTLVMVLFVYGMTTAVGGNGFLAVYISGLVIGYSTCIHKRSLIHFHEGIAWLMQITMFLTLGLLVFPSQLLPVLMPGIVIALILIFVARPIAVYLSLIPWKMQKNEKVLLSWVGLRGAAPIVLATFPLIAGIPQAYTIFNMVFFIVIISALIHGTSIPFVARLLKLDAPLPSISRFNIDYMPDISAKNEHIELTVAPGSKADNKQVVELDLPEGTLIILVARGEDQFVPGGSTVLLAGDVILVLVAPENEVRVKQIVQGVEEPGPGNYRKNTGGRQKEKSHHLSE